MQVDISEPILSKLANYSVGLVIRDDRAGSRVLGSGTLVSIDGRRGILTCGHVAEQYERLDEIGMIHFMADGKRQRRMVKIGDAFTVIVQSEADWSKHGFDLAFTYLPPDVADGIAAAQGVFLNIEKNREKMEGGEPAGATHTDAALGLVAEFSDKPFVENGELVSPMRGVLHSGHVIEQESGLLTMDPMDYNLHGLPESFGGMSGAGLWRIHHVESGSGVEILRTTLCGVVAWEIPEGKRLACQGWDRIDQALVPTVREKLRL